VTIDGQTLTDQTVTIRERDSMKQGAHRHRQGCGLICKSSSTPAETFLAAAGLNPDTAFRRAREGASSSGMIV